LLKERLKAQGCRREDRMGFHATSRVRSLAATIGAVALVTACSGGPGEGDEGTGTELLASCSFSVTQNVYDGPNYWGTITVKNTSSSSVTGFAVQFSIPSGDHCTNDAVPSGATLSPLNGSGSAAKTVSNVCKFTWSSATLSAGASLTFNYSTDNTNFTAASGVSVSSSSCGAAADAGTHLDAGHDADAAPASDADAGPIPHTGNDGGSRSCPLAVTGKAPPSGTGMFVESFTGAVTVNEVSTFKTYIKTINPAPDNIGNNWAQGYSGEETKAMGLMYEISGDVAILDRMLVFCDAVLSERNDLAPAPVGQHVLWTGRIDPAWPNQVTTTPIGTGGEQGDPVGHLGSCARLVLTTPAIWSRAVGSGDPHHFGQTYLERAQRYVKEADFAIDNHILKSLLNVSNQDRQTFSTASPYQGGKPVPWNQQMMFNYGFQNLAASHAILGDDPARVVRYDALVQSSYSWFFHGGGSVTRTDSRGNSSYDWGYAPGGMGEDSNHGSLDVAGFSRAYSLGRYGLTDAMMHPFADTFVDIMDRGPGNYAGRVDGTDGTGHASPTTYIRSGYLLLSEFRPDAYLSMMGADLVAGAMTGSIDRFSRFAWVKNRLCVRGIHP
jgi:hypothetical protein